MSCSGLRAHRPPLWSSIGIYNRTAELASTPLAPCTLQRRQGERSAAFNIVTGLVMVSGGVSMEKPTVLYWLENSRLTAIRYPNGILDPIVRLPGFRQSMQAEPGG